MKTRPPSVPGGSGTVTGSGSGSGSPSITNASGSTSSHAQRPRRRVQTPSGTSSCPRPTVNSFSERYTPPPDKDSNAQGKFAGISPESIQCISEQIAVDQLSEEARSLLAEDVSYKLRQLIHNVALYAKHVKNHRMEVDDVNAVLGLMDTEPVLGPAVPQWVPIEEAEHLCTTFDPVVDLFGTATRHQKSITLPPPNLSASWIVESKNSIGDGSISPDLQNYYLKISKALLSNNVQLTKLALRDLRTNTRIGPIVPYIINLSLLVLSELSTPVGINIIWHKQALKILDFLLINPCCGDTDVTLQLQRLFPILISNILTENILSNEMLRIMLSVVTVWPQLAHIGRNIVLEYLSQEVEERLNGPLVECLTALGRKALVDGLTLHMPLIEAMSNVDNVKMFRLGLYEAILNSSYTYLILPNDTYDPKIAYIDKCLYEILGDAIVPRRVHRHIETPIESTPIRNDLDISPHSPIKTKKKSKCRAIKYFSSEKKTNFISNAFELRDTKKKFLFSKDITINVPGFRQYQSQQRLKREYDFMNSNPFVNGGNYRTDKKMKVVIANGLLLRFKYKLPYVRKSHTNYDLYVI